jgi:hypothetical protein
MKPTRVQLSRRKGWRMPRNTMKVDRTTPWGNPFIVGEDGTRAECMDLFCSLASRGAVALSVSKACVDRQGAFMAALREGHQKLAGKHLACWCSLSEPCHADVLLAIVNAEE